MSSVSEVAVLQPVLFEIETVLFPDVSEISRVAIPDVHLGLPQTFKMERFATIVNS